MRKPKVTAFTVIRAFKIQILSMLNLKDLIQTLAYTEAESRQKHDKIRYPPHKINAFQATIT